MMIVLSTTEETQDFCRYFSAVHHCIESAVVGANPSTSDQNAHEFLIRQDLFSYEMILMSIVVNEANRDVVFTTCFSEDKLNTSKGGTGDLT